ncbi:MAG TPA: methionyl-tRNA formyltransferase [bacterium]|nr:methionyl-tRNA formyltransferase [bacterium]
MRIAFFGTPSFAVPVLNSILQSGHDTVIAVTRPDRPSGRKMEIKPCPVKEAALLNSIPVLQPESVKEQSFMDKYREYGAELNVITAFGQIIPDELIYMPKYDSINIHASLLPKYRGASPINHAIMNGDNETGISFQFIEKRLDAGDIIHSASIPISAEDTSITLYEKLSSLAAEHTPRVLELISSGRAQRIKQDESKASTVKTLKKEDGRINFSMSAEKIHNMARGLLPWPCAYCTLDSKMLKIMKSSLSDSTAGSPGEVTASGKNTGFIVRASDKSVVFREVQYEGGKKMNAYDFFLGRRGLLGKILE